MTNTRANPSPTRTLNLRLNLSAIPIHFNLVLSIQECVSGAMDTSPAQVQQHWPQIPWLTHQVVGRW